MGIKALITTTSVILLTSCAVLNYQPKTNSVGGPNDNRIPLDLQECKQLAKTSAINASDGTGSQVSVKDRFKSAYDNCMSGRGHNVLR
jgi:hypothetical protein